MFDYIERTPALEDILVSGGDLYTLSPGQIRMIGTRLLGIPHILRIRFASKGLAICPSRLVDPKDGWAGVIIDLTRQGRKIGKSVALHTHFNHPHEITWITRLAAQRLFEEGVTVRNQTVLLNGVNNTVDTMKSLIKQLSSMHIQPVSIENPPYFRPHDRTKFGSGADCLYHAVLRFPMRHDAWDRGYAYPATRNPAARSLDTRFDRGVHDSKLRR